MFRKYFMQDKVGEQDIKHVIGHNSSIYIKPSVVAILLLLVLYIVYLLLSKYLDFASIKRIFAGLGVMILVKYIIDFLNLYLDALALSLDGLTFFAWEGLLEYKTEYFDRDKIVTINHQQNGLRDKLFNRGDLLINLEQGIEFPFEQITAPKKQVDKIMKRKERHERAHIPQPRHDYKTDHHAIPHDNMQLVMEAFSEVVKEYMEKKKTD